MFKLNSQYKPTGDQLKAIQRLTDGLNHNTQHQTLLGVTGSGKTFTIANVIKNVQKPTLIISHNKTLAAQLYQEFKEFFPTNSVQFFISYYDYYQPEAYIPQRDLYIEKDADINQEIDKLRLATTTSLLTRSDVIVIASVSCIYNLGSPIEYKKAVAIFRIGQEISKNDVFQRLVEMMYERNEFDFKRGTFRNRGNKIDIYPSYFDIGVSIEIISNKISNIEFFDVISGEYLDTDEAFKLLGPDVANLAILSNSKLEGVVLYPSKHYVFDYTKVQEPIKKIYNDLQLRIDQLKKEGKELEAYRLKQNVEYDIDMMKEIGYCKGVENYSIYFDSRQPGSSPFTLFDYFPEDFLLIIDESHITIPQIRGMYNGDYARKKILIDYGFRLPSAFDNRPLKFNEFVSKCKNTIYMSATPSEYEIQMSGKENIVELLIRPTGIVDPEVEIRKAEGQVVNLIEEIKTTVSKGGRVLVTTLTKRMAEDLSKYLSELQIKVTYLHSDIKTLERSDLLNELREGKYDVLVGISLLREGLDLPEVKLVAILDADKEGFLRSKGSLIQTMGRAARNVNGRVILYANNITKSIKDAVDEVNRRREVQLKYNRINKITPYNITKSIRERILPKLEEPEEGVYKKDIDLSVVISSYRVSGKKEKTKMLKLLRMEMKKEAELLNFERAIELREIIKSLK